MEEFTQLILSYFIIFCIVILVLYVIESIIFYSIAQKFNPYGAKWKAFIPFLSKLVILDILEENNLKILLLFIPVVGELYLIKLYKVIFSRLNFNENVAYLGLAGALHNLLVIFNMNKSNLGIFCNILIFVYFVIQIYVLFFRSETKLLLDIGKDIRGPIN